MKLFDYKDFHITLNEPEILLVREFKEVWRADKTEGKTKAFKIFQYIYLLCDFSSPYRFFNESEREDKAKEDSGLDSRTIKSALVVNCVSKYLEILDSNRILRLINSMYKAFDELEVYFATINFTEKVEHGARKGTLQYSPTELIRVMKEANTAVRTLKDLEEQVKEELSQDAGIRGGLEPSFIMEENE